MVGTRLVYGCLLVLAALLLGSCAPDAVALRQGTVGRALTVEGTTGQIVADRETATHSVFTLRDNYGDIAYVRVPRSSGRGYPVMRVTYRVTGTLARGDDGAFLLRETARYRVYDPFRWVLLLAGVALAGALLAIVVVRCLTRRQVERLKKELPALLPDPAPGGPALMPPWGRLVVETGPDVGKVFELREARITIGRDVPDAALDVLLAGDELVSRHHGLLERDGGTLYYTDTDSKHGTRINVTEAARGARLRLRGGDLLQFGPLTIARLEVFGEKRGAPPRTRVSRPGGSSPPSGAKPTVRRDPER